MKLCQVSKGDSCQTQNLERLRDCLGRGYEGQGVRAAKEPGHNHRGAPDVLKATQKKSCYRVKAVIH